MVLSLQNYPRNAMLDFFKGRVFEASFLIPSENVSKADDELEIHIVPAAPEFIAGLALVGEGQNERYVPVLNLNKYLMSLKPELRETVKTENEDKFYIQLQNAAEAIILALEPVGSLISAQEDEIQAVSDWQNKPAFFEFAFFDKHIQGQPILNVPLFFDSFDE